MFNSIRKWWVGVSNKGMHFPFIHDPRSKKPSITLLFAYLSFAMAFISIILLHIWVHLVIATVTSILFWAMAVIFYRLRNLDKAKIDFDDKSIELEGNEDGE